MKEKPPTHAEEMLLRHLFPPHTYQQWRAAAEAALKGAAFEAQLLTPLEHGLTLKPLYTQEDIEGLEHLEQLPGLPNFVRGTAACGYVAAPWAISQANLGPTPEVFNQQARADLECGLEELNIPLDSPTGLGLDPDAQGGQGIGEGGLSLATCGDLEQALAELPLERLALFFQPTTVALPLAAMLLAMARRRGLPWTALRGCLSADPLGQLASQGDLPLPLAAAWKRMALWTRFAIDHAPGLQTVSVSSRPYADGGATAIQELGYVIATAVETLRELGQRGLSATTVAPRMRFVFSIGGQFFIEIAKLRAARLLWSKVIRASGAPAEAAAMHLHCRTGLWNKTVYDPHVNILRATTEGLAAILGGCNSLELDPFDQPARLPDALSRRLAQNTQLILREECHLRQAIDPAGGSWYVEWLTDQLARKAWELLQQIERSGGMTRALQDGAPQAAVAEVAANRLKKIAQRREILVGTNLYPNPLEKRLANRRADQLETARQRAEVIGRHRQSTATAALAPALSQLSCHWVADSPQAVMAAIEAADRGATLNQLEAAIGAADPGAGQAIAPIPRRRGAAPFEALRSRAEALGQQSGTPPRVFQANLGPSHRYRARADWTSGFFQVAGFEVLADQEFDNAAAAIAAAIQSGAPIVVLVGTDQTYQRELPAAAHQLKTQAPKRTLLVAGNPGVQELSWRQAGVDALLNLNVNALELLENLLTTIGGPA